MYLAIDLWCWFLGIWLTSYLAWYLSSFIHGPVRIGVNILFFLGVIVHEFSHLFACLMCGVPVEGIKIKWRSNNGVYISPHGSVTPGDFERRSLMKGLMISFAPLLVSTFLFFGCIDTITLIDVHFIIKIFALFFAISLILTAAPSQQDLSVVIWALTNDTLLSISQLTCLAISFFVSITFLNFSLFKLPFEFIYYALYFIGTIVLYFIIFYSLKWMGRGTRMTYQALFHKDVFFSSHYRTRVRINSKKAPKEKKRRMVVRMKGMCILIIAFALILSYQNNPLGTIIIGGISILIYAFFKSRKGKSGIGRAWGFNTGKSYQNSQMEDLINYLLVQNYLKNNPMPNEPREGPAQSPKPQEIETMKNEILSLFDEE